MEKVYMPALSRIKKAFPDIQTIEVEKVKSKKTGITKLRFYINTQNELTDEETCQHLMAVTQCLKSDHVPDMYSDICINDHKYLKENCMELLLGSELYSLEGMDAQKKYIRGDSIIFINQESLFPQ